MAIKIVVLGDQNVGKTQLVNPNFSHRYSPTLGVDHSKRLVPFPQESHPTELDIWDYSGAEETWQQFTASLYVVVFDTTNTASLSHVDDYLTKIVAQYQNSSLPPIFIVATKIDLLDNVNGVNLVQEKLLELKNKYPHLPLKTFAVSGREYQGCDEFFKQVAESGRQHIESHPVAPTLNSPPSLRFEGAAVKKQKNFLERHWKKLLICTLALGGFIAFCCLTAGVGLWLTIALTVSGLIIGSAVGVLTGIIRDHQRKQAYCGNIVNENASHTGRDQVYIMQKLALINGIEYRVLPELTSLVAKNFSSKSSSVLTPMAITVESPSPDEQSLRLIRR